MNNSLPLISILIPIFNGIEFIDESVSSIKNQTYNNWELLIGINGHCINSDVYKIAKKYENEKIFIFQFSPETIKGKPNTLNELVKYTSSQSQYVALLDVDDIWHPTKLEKQIPYLYMYDVIGTQCFLFGDVNYISQNPNGDLSNHNFLNSNPIINSSSLIKKELAFWNANSFFDDYELWLLLKKQNKRFFNLYEPLVKHRVHNNSAFNSVEKSNKYLYNSNLNRLRNKYS